MSERGRRSAAGVVVVAVLAGVLVGGPAVTAASAGPIVGTPGAPGIGDPYFPHLGNGGYDVSDYHLDLAYGPAKYHISGTATITATAKQDLSQYDFDLAGLSVTAINVDGVPATSWSRQRSELVVTPATPVSKGATFVTTVTYHGMPQLRSSASLGTYGWFPSHTGVVMAGEPIAGQLWFPCNDHPADKATFSLTMAVPDGLRVVSNGLLVGTPTSDGTTTTFVWASTHPMPTYAATVAVGKFRIHQYTSARGVPVYDAVEQQLPRRVDRALHSAGQIVDFFSKHFGPYPVEAAGGIVMATSAGFALETQTRPVYTSGFFGAGGDNTEVVAHELAHMWFGDNVSLHRWRDIWLNEGFATYLEWLWVAHHDQIPLRRIVNSEYSYGPGSPHWRLKIGNPGPAHLFDWPVYSRGALTLQALRLTVGSGDFFRIMRTWEQRRGGSTGTTTQFKALAERISGHQLDGLFRRWLETSGKPSLP
jgi:aminopeptidase N